MASTTAGITLVASVGDTNTSGLITPEPTTEVEKFHIVVLVILSIVSAVGIIGNLFIIGSICLYKRLRVRGNVFIVNLAVADLVIVAYIMPVGLATSQFKENPFSQTMCDVNAFLIMTSCGVSTQTLMFIAIERYFHICKMHFYRKAFTPHLIGFYIALIWIYTAAWTAQGWTGWTRYVYGQHVFLCIFAGPVSISYDVCLAFFGMLLPMVVLGVCYYKIFRTVVSSRRAITAHKKKMAKASKEAARLHRPESEKQADREYRLIITLFTIVIVFVVCWLPACIVVTASGVWKNMPRWINKAGMWLALINSAGNCLIYGLFNHQFRKGYRTVLEKVLCCGRSLPPWCVHPSLGRRNKKVIYRLCMWLAMSNSGVNSIIYGLFNHHFRNGYKLVLQKVFWCCRLPLDYSIPQLKDLYPVSIWLAVCNSGMNSFIYGILNKNFRSGYKQLLQHIFCCMIFKRHGKCRDCTSLLEDKDSTSDSRIKSDGTKHTKGSSVSPSSQSTSDSSNMRSAGSADTRDMSFTNSHQSLASPGVTNTASRPPTLAPIKYASEPQSGAPIGKQNGVHVTTHNQSADMEADMSMSIVHTGDGQMSPILVSESSFFSTATSAGAGGIGPSPPSNNGSQSSLIRRSANNSEIGSVDNSTFVPDSAAGVNSRPTSSTMWAQPTTPRSQSIGHRPQGSHPSASIARKRPTSGQGTELSMSNVVLETKM